MKTVTTKIESKPDMKMILKEIRKFDKDLDLKSDEALAQAFLLSAAAVGTSLSKICQFMKVPKDKIKPMWDLARENQIFKGRKVHADWFEKDGYIGLLADSCVVLGWMNRVKK